MATIPASFSDCDKIYHKLSYRPPIPTCRPVSWSSWRVQLKFSHDLLPLQFEQFDQFLEELIALYLLRILSTSNSPKFTSEMISLQGVQYQFQRHRPTENLPSLSSFSPPNTMALPKWSALQAQSIGTTISFQNKFEIIRNIIFWAIIPKVWQYDANAKESKILLYQLTRRHPA